MTTEIGLDPTTLHRDMWQHQRTQLETRSDVAVMIWAIVADFTGDVTPLQVLDDDAWRPAEAYIREHAAEAESRTIEYGGRPHEVIVPVLNELSLADDYLRIKRDEQHMAFEDVPAEPTLRKTSPGIYMAYEPDGEYLGTVQSIDSEWWAIEPGGGTPHTRRTRAEAVAALRDAAAAGRALITEVDAR